MDTGSTGGQGCGGWKAPDARNIRSELIPQRPEVHAELPRGHRHSEGGRNKAVGERQRAAALFVDHGTALVHRHEEVFLCLLQRSAVLVQRRQRPFQVREAACEPRWRPPCDRPQHLPPPRTCPRRIPRKTVRRYRIRPAPNRHTQWGHRGFRPVRSLLYSLAAVLVQQLLDLPQLRRPLVGVLRAQHAVDPADEPALAAHRSRPR